MHSLHLIGLGRNVRIVATLGLVAFASPTMAFEDEWRERRLETPMGMEDTGAGERAIGFRRDADHRRIETNSIYGLTLSSALGNQIDVEAAVDLNQSDLAYSMDSVPVSGIFTPSYRPGRHGLGDVEATSAAIGNSLSIEFGEYGDAVTSSRQFNRANATALNLTAAADRFDSAEITSAAIGNALNITNVTD